MLDLGVLRPLGGVERFFYKYSQINPSHFVLVAELECQIALTALEIQDAVRTVQRRHPLLGAAIQHHRRHGPCFYASIDAVDVEVSSLDRWDEWDAAAQAELARDFVVERGPLWRVHALLDDRAPVIILTFHHAIADGLAAVEVARDLVQALRGKALSGRAVPASLEASLRRNFNVTSAGEPAEAAAQQEGLAALGRRPLWRAFEQDRCRVSKGLIDKNVTADLVVACRRNGATLQGLLCAGFVLARPESSSATEPVVVVSPISYRRALDRSSGDCALLIAAAAIAVPAVSLERLWSAAQLYSRALGQQRALSSLALSVGMLETLIAPDTDPRVACGLTAAMGTAGSVTNLGPIDLGPQRGAIRLKTIWGPILQSRLIGERIVGVTTVADQLHLAETRAEGVTSSLAPMVEILRAVAGGSPAQHARGAAETIRLV